MSDDGGRDILMGRPERVPESVIMVRFPGGPHTTEPTVTYQNVDVGQLQVAAAELADLARDSRMAQRMQEAQRRAVVGLQLPGQPSANGAHHG